MELFRFRIVRPVLTQPCDGLDVATLLEPALDAEALKRAADTAASQAPAANTAPLEKTLAAFSNQLAIRGDLVAPQDCLQLLPTALVGQVGAQAWVSLGHQLVLKIVHSMGQATLAPAATESLCRHLLVYDLVNTLASDESKSAADRKLKTAADVKAMITWRPVILPSQYFPGTSKTPLLARRPGFTDFYTVHDEWNHYQPGELAAVINVLPGETFETQIRHSQDVDTLTSTTTTTTTSQLTEQQQTTSSSLSDASTKDSALNIGVQGQVQTSGQYGATKVTTSLGAQLQVSQSQSEAQAMTTAYETVQRAVKSVSQQVTTVQSQRTITRDSTYSDHKLQNAGPDVTVGLYRWLSEVHYVQLMRYPNRFVLEFEVPEPGAWLRWALHNTPQPSWDNPDPGPFRLPAATADLSPDQITLYNYTSLAAQWRVRGLAPPPTSSVSAVWNRAWNTTQGNGPAAVNDQIAIPDGYMAISATMGVSLAAVNPQWPYVVIVQLGATPSTERDDAQAIEVRFGNDEAPGARPSYDQPQETAYTTLLNNERGQLGVTLGFGGVTAFQVNIEVTCQLTPEAFTQWQQRTFDQVASAYQARLSAFQQERANRSQLPGGLADLAGPPELNRSRAGNELRRMVIQDLLGQELAGQDDVQTGGTQFGPDEPYVPAVPPADTDMIQFFEQAFEWENLVYLCYPYYWARHSQWVTDATSGSADPEFDQFLNAGSARVVVPARPGFESLVLFYLYTGVIWGGINPPAPNDPDYLSVAQEIQSLETGATTGTPIGSSWEITLPTTLLWAGTDATTLPVNPSPTIPPPGT